MCEEPKGKDTDAPFHWFQLMHCHSIGMYEAKHNFALEKENKFRKFLLHKHKPSRLCFKRYMERYTFGSVDI